MMIYFKIAVVLLTFWTRSCLGGDSSHPPSFSGKTAPKDCDLNGQWYDPIFGKDAQIIYRIGDNGTRLYAVTLNILGWLKGNLSINGTSSDLAATFDNGEKLTGTLVTCEYIQWNDSKVVSWYKIPEVREVHVIFMNHLDVGYNGIEATGFINNVVNVYFDSYFPRAISLGMEMDKNESKNRGFVYTTHPWLVYMYLNCPKDFKLNNITLHCPSTSNISSFEDAIRKGYIRWHAGPMNMQMELMNEKMLDIAMWISTELDNKYRKGATNRTRVWSLRDVPGMTKSVISYFLKNGISGVSVGVNPSSSPPAVPSLFLWKENLADKDGIVAFWHKGGYPRQPGPSLEKAGGLSIGDTVFSMVDKQALTFAFRTDNRGPPDNTDEILSNYDIIEKQFPGAKVFASTMEDFIGTVTKSSLPIVTDEIGDTWIQGIASDPRKMALYRAAIRALRCDPPKCSWSWDAVKDFALYLVKIPEHTWGLPSADDNFNWSNIEFKAVLNSSKFVACIQSWLEQREFFNLTQSAATQSDSSQWYAANLKEELSDMYPSLPLLEGYKEADIGSSIYVNTTGGSIRLGFLKTGAIGELVYYRRSGSSFTLAREDSTIGQLLYYTYNGTDFDYMTSRYNYNGNAGYSKPDSDKRAHPNSTESMFYVKNFYTNETATKDNHWCVLMELVGYYFMNYYYGSPQVVWVLVKVGPSSIPNVLFEINFEVTLFNKTATRLPESTMFSFTPARIRNGTEYRGFYYKISDSNPIPMELVVLNGSQYQHAVESVKMTSMDVEGKTDISIVLSSLDVPLVCPVMTNTSFHTPTPFPAPLEPVNVKNLKGFSFNIHNNIWNTNYPLWYPIIEEDKDFKSRYSMVVFEEGPMSKAEPFMKAAMDSFYNNL